MVSCISLTKQIEELLMSSGMSKFRCICQNQRTQWHKRSSMLPKSVRQSNPIAQHLVSFRSSKVQCKGITGKKMLLRSQLFKWLIECYYTSFNVIINAIVQDLPATLPYRQPIYKKYIYWQKKAISHIKEKVKLQIALADLYRQHNLFNKKKISLRKLRKYSCVIGAWFRRHLFIEVGPSAKSWHHHKQQWEYCYLC